MPKMTGLSTDTYLFDAKELCIVFAQAITEVKEGEVDVGSPLVVTPHTVEQTNIKPTPYGVQDFAKVLQIVAHELYLEKQRINMR